MRTLILATASAIALGIAGAGPLHAQTATTSTPSTTATGQNPAVMQPAAPQSGNGMDQGTPSMSGTSQYNSSAAPSMSGTSQDNSSTMAATAPSTDNSGQTSQNGWSHSRSDVRQIQQRLSADGLYRGPIDGIDGPQMRQALRQYQKNNGLPVTGRLDSQTTASLTGGNGPGIGSTTPATNGSDMNPPAGSNAGDGNTSNTPATTR
jgi:peptidoglycan hydrolase-like protein with peptidoglycan-binding domain